MAEEPRTDAVRRFAADLRVLREARGVSLQQLHRDTKIPVDVLEGFEGTGLTGNRMFNRVYLRSLVRSYTTTLGLPSLPVLESLDGVFDGRYDGDLLTLPLGDAPPPRRLRPDEPARSADGDRVPSEDLPPEDSPDPASSPTFEGASEPMTPETAAAEMAGAARDEAARAADEPPAVTDDAPAQTPAERQRQMVQMTPEPLPTESVFDRIPERAGPPSWIIALGALVVLGAIAAGLFAYFGRDRAAPTAPQETTGVAPMPSSPDTSVGPGTSATSTPGPATSLATGTAPLVIRAEGASLQGLRVRIDADTRRPYWIEVGRERSFAFRDSIQVFDPPAAARLSLGGQPVAATPDASGRVVVRRR